MAAHHPQCEKQVALTSVKHGQRQEVRVRSSVLKEKEEEAKVKTDYDTVH